MNNEMDRYSQTLSHRNRFPNNWKLKPFWSITKKTSETNNEGLDLLSVYLNQGVVRFDDVNEKRTNVTSEDTSKYQKVEKGNLVLNNQQAWRGSVGVSRFKGIVSPAYIVLELTDELETGFSNYLFRDQYMVDNYAMSSKGVGSIQRNIFFPILRTTPVPIPPFQEQQLISRYLDKKTEQIDSLIEKIQKKIELLKEQRTSLINQVVTKGLDPNVEMKDSGVEWIGEIPKHWGIIKIGHYSNIIRGSSPRPAGDPRLFGGSFIPWITVKEVTKQKTKYIQSTETFLTEEGMNKSTKVYPGTLLFSNSGATLGVPRFTELEGCINDGSVAFLDIRPSLSPEFLYWFLTTQTTRLRSEQSGFGQPNLNTEIVSNIRVPLPPIEEQNNISTKIEKISRQIDELIFLSDRKSNVLNEYRQSLMSSVVTGKVRVTEDMI